MCWTMHNQFAGKTKNDGFDGGKNLKPASPGARVVEFVVRKMRVIHDVPTSGKTKT